MKLPLEENAGRWDQDRLVEIQLPHTAHTFPRALGMAVPFTWLLPDPPSLSLLLFHCVQDDLGPSSGLGTLRQVKAGKRKEWLKLFQIWDTHHRPPPTAPHPRQGSAAPGALRPSPHNTTSQESEPSPPSLHFHSCWNQEMRFQLHSSKSNKYLQRIVQAQGSAELATVDGSPLPSPASWAGSRFRAMRPHNRALLSINTRSCCLQLSPNPSPGHEQEAPRGERCTQESPRENAPQHMQPLPTPGALSPPEKEGAEDKVISAPIRGHRGSRNLGAWAFLLIRRRSCESLEGAPPAFTVQPAGRRLSDGPMQTPSLYLVLQRKACNSILWVRHRHTESSIFVFFLIWKFKTYQIFNK